MKWDDCPKEQLIINGYWVAFCPKHQVVELSTGPAIPEVRVPRRYKIVLSLIGFLLILYAVTEGLLYFGVKP